MLYINSPEPLLDFNFALRPADLFHSGQLLVATSEMVKCFLFSKIKYSFALKTSLS